MEDLVALLLGHAGVDEVATSAHLSDLLGQKLNTLDRVAENHRLYRHTEEENTAQKNRERAIK